MGRPPKEAREPRDGRVMLACGLCRQPTEHARTRTDRPGFYRCIEAREGAVAHGRTVEGDTESLVGEVVPPVQRPALVGLRNRGMTLAARPVAAPPSAPTPDTPPRTYRRRRAQEESTMPRPKQSTNLIQQAVAAHIFGVYEKEIEPRVEATVRRLLGLEAPAGSIEPKPKRKYTRRAAKVA